MRALHWLIKLVFSAAIIAGGVLVYMYPVSELWGEFTSRAAEPNELLRQIGGGIIAGVALIAFLPLWPKRKRGKEITFEGTHGEVTVQLEPVEKVMVNVVEKLPEVKQVDITIKPTDEPGQVVVEAVGVLYKDGNGDARQITARVNSFIQGHTRKILGLQDIKVKFRVTRWLMRMKTIKPGPLLLEAPESDDGPVAPAEAPAVESIPSVIEAPAPPPIPQVSDMAAVREELLVDAAADMNAIESISDVEETQEDIGTLPDELPEAILPEADAEESEGTNDGSPLDALIERSGGNSGPLWASSSEDTETGDGDTSSESEEQPSRGW